MSERTYEESCGVVLRAMGYERLVGTVAEWAVLDGQNPDGTVRVAALIHERHIDANWCFGVLVPWLETQGLTFELGNYGDGWGAHVLTNGSVYLAEALPVEWSTAPTVEEAMIRAAAQALEEQG